MGKPENKEMSMIEWLRLQWCRIRYPRFDVRHYGARGNGRRDKTDAIQRALNLSLTRRSRRDD
jgi:hypothetical protein